MQTDHPIQVRRLDLVLINKKKRICYRVDFAMSADNRVKMKESKKLDKYLDHARELTKQQNMKVTLIQIIVRALGTWKRDLMN